MHKFDLRKMSIAKLSVEFQNSKISDLKNSEVPECLYWTVRQVCEFFEKELEFPEYKVN